MSLNDIVQSAQGGEAVNNLASRFGLTPEQTQSAINALLPAFEMGLQNKLQSGGGGLGSILGQLAGEGQPPTASDPGAIDSGAASAHGASVLGDLFGGAHTNGQVAQQASAESGVPPEILQAMLPILASLVMNGLSNSAQGGNLGGILSQVLGGAGGQAGGLGSILGQIVGGGHTAAPAPGQAADSGLSGLLGSVLGGLFGGGTQPQTAPAAPAGSAAAPAESTLDELSQMFQAGTSSSPEHQANLANIFGRNG
jgi:hypothetical protein